MNVQINKEQAEKVVKFLENKKTFSYSHNNPRAARAVDERQAAINILFYLGISESELQKLAKSDEQPSLFPHVQMESDLRKEIKQLEQEVKRLRSKYEERCWCSVRVPATCAHKRWL